MAHCRNNVLQSEHETLKSRILHINVPFWSDVKYWLEKETDLMKGKNKSNSEQNLMSTWVLRAPLRVLTIVFAKLSYKALIEELYTDVLSLYYYKSIHCFIHIHIWWCKSASYIAPSLAEWPLMILPSAWKFWGPAKQKKV